MPFVKKALFGGLFQDVLTLQTSHKDSRRLADVHSRAKQYDNKTEHLYSFLQVGQDIPRLVLPSDYTGLDLINVPT